jgi:hypothetical protein
MAGDPEQATMRAEMRKWLDANGNHAIARKRYSPNRWHHGDFSQCRRGQISQNLQRVNPVKFSSNLNGLQIWAAAPGFDLVFRWYCLCMFGAPPFIAFRSRDGILARL